MILEKDYMRNRKNQIEQDMAPFGFISDGLDDTSFVDNSEIDGILMSMVIDHICGIILKSYKYESKANSLNFQIIQELCDRFGSRVEILKSFIGGTMSGDSGLNETVVFYSKKMTQAKLIVLQHKGIQLAYKSLKEVSDAKVETSET